VSPDARSPNLDVSLKVMNSSGTVIATAKPAATLQASVTVSLPTAGKYFVIVDGVGVLNPLNTGYSDYGSLGQYKVTGTVPTP